MIRQCTSRIASIHFAPTMYSKNCLLKEGIPENKIHITGNTVIDALIDISGRIGSISNDPSIEEVFNNYDNIVLTTVHRRENHGERLSSIIDSIKNLA